MSKGSHRNNNKNRKRKENDSKPNQTTNAKQEMKFAPVGRNGNFAPHNTVKEAGLLEAQSESHKAMAPLIESIGNEKEPDWDCVKPAKEHVSFDPDTGSIGKETMEVRMARQRLGAQQGTAGVTSRGQGGQESPRLENHQLNPQIKWKRW